VAGVDGARLNAELAAILTDGKRDPGPLLKSLRGWLDRHQAALRERFEADHDAEAVVYERCRLIDALVCGLLTYANTHEFPLANPTAGERLAVIAVGGYGRGELAPHSDVDLLFLHPYKRTPHGEQMVEYLLYKLWDLGLKVGQATRSIAECLRLARTDVAVCTSLLEARFLWGDAPGNNASAARLEERN
jgi:[protein-PII] uridylyltransferase